MSIQLEPQYLQRVKEILDKFLPTCEVWAFGSRVEGTQKKFSDLDLVVVREEPLKIEILAS